MSAAKGKSASNKSGGFQSMGLSHPVLKGILKRGYKVPTPIQRKTIPLALNNRDVVAMARTGSGKTACFLIPMFEKLKTRQPTSGARALILSPTRELALQTARFIKEMGRFTGLKASTILGGDSMEGQFSALHENPDIIVATPGRFLHLCIEMDMNLKNIQFVVYDEADRLFEMGFGEQLHEITNRLPVHKQTLLFSATLPKILVEFAKAGLDNPVLIRLDVESKLPEGLKLSFITCRPEEKLAVLMCLLKRVIKPDTQTVVFAATMHHVEYIHMILDKVGISNTYIYSNLDPTARKINAAKFQSGKVKVLVVTDVAARGIDIPHLDNVINFHFPAKSKLFVHRVGRCARAGRSGIAYNIVSPDEYPALLDLHLFLGRSLNIVPATKKENIPEESIGRLPKGMIEEELSDLITWHEDNTDIYNMEKVCENAYQQYLRSRPAASIESNKRVKELNFETAGILPEFQDENDAVSEFLLKMKSYRPPGTVFEILSKPGSTDYKAMKEKRSFHKDNILNHHRKIEERENKIENLKPVKSNLPSSTTDEIANAFKEVVQPKKRKIDSLYKNEKAKKRRKLEKDEEFFIPYAAVDKHTEDGLAVNSFATEADKATLDFTADNEESMRLSKQLKKWDRKKKKMVAVDNPKAAKIRTESGVWIPASYKTQKYKQWKDKNNVENSYGAEDDGDNDEAEASTNAKNLQTRGNTHWARHNQKLKEKEMKKVRSELKTPDQIRKERKLKKKNKLKNQKGGRGRGKGGSKGKGKKSKH
ncbi:ATP-dependent RNA helicase DDX54 [Trichogramma pretiosum]|uniref:ATP-dependent RNA helicase DDX54 n=1 Tax=Trichogramma pretiosum TaxID=7493 RepID=UPI0006C984AE|nr:ATP-dependent RNA helicase DDX54 [Trichogramma pretiosum]